MPSNQTSNYQLSQWSKTDRVKMEDFNADNAKLDANLKAVDSRVDALSAGKAEASALAALTGRVAQLEQSRFYIGGYTGDGKATRTITLPWAPVFMIMFTDFDNYDTAAMFLTQTRNGYLIKDAVTYDTEYIPTLHGASLRFPNDNANRQGKPAWYIMFR